MPAKKSMIESLGPKDGNMFMNDCLELSLKKMPEGLRNEEEYKEPFKYLCGDDEVVQIAPLHQKRYTNLIFPAWKSFAPKFCGKPPEYIFRPQDEEYQKLSECCQALFAAKTEKFKYSEMILSVCQDAFFTPVGYGRHAWDEKAGCTITKRFKPTDVFIDYSCNDIDQSKYVIERHRIRRYEFANKYGKEIAYSVDSQEGCVKFPCSYNSDKYPSGRHPMDEIEYYLFWSRIDGDNRVYTFLKNPDSQEVAEQWVHKSKVDGRPGEPTKQRFGEGKWHLTPLRLSPINGRQGGLSTWKAVKGVYLQFQDLSGAVVKASEESAKKVLLYPKALDRLMQQMSQAGGTLALVPFDRQDIQAQNIDDVFKLIEMPGPDENLINVSNILEQRVGEISGVSAVQRGNPDKVETAVEARTLSDYSINRIADDQGNVERWTETVGKKELACDLSMMPRRSVVRVNRSEKGGYGSKGTGEGEGEEQDTTKGADSKGKPDIIQDVPYLEACLLERGVPSQETAMEQVKARQKAIEQEVLAGNPEAQNVETPMEPEVEVRFRMGIPMDADVEIISPGIEQFVGADLSQFWDEGMTERQIESQLTVRIQLGSSSPAGRSQELNEALMIAKQMEPIYKEYGQHEALCDVYNNIIDASEKSQLNDARLDKAKVIKFVEDNAKAQEEQAEKEFQRQLALKTAPKDSDPQAVEAELIKSKDSLTKQQLVNENTMMKNEGQLQREESRDRRQNEQQLAASQPGAMA